MSNGSSPSDAAYRFKSSIFFKDDVLLISVTHTPDRQKNHPPENAHFFLYSIICPDQSLYSFVFEIRHIISVKLLIEEAIRTSRMNRY